MGETMTAGITRLNEWLFVGVLAVAMAVFQPTTLAFSQTVRVVAFGDSLVAGLGLQQEEAFPAKLQQALAARGHDVEIINAGVSGDTTAGGLARIDWSVPADASAVILELGANDMLRGVDPAVTMANLESIIQRLKERKIPVLLAGMRASPNMGEAYVNAFDPLFGQLAEKYAVPLYPFFLDGVAGNSDLNQPDGMHPTAAGVDRMVELFLPQMEVFLAQIAAGPAEK